MPLWAVGSGSDALIRNPPVNTEVPVPQLVLDRSIKMLAVNELSRIGETSSFPSCRLADAREKRLHHASEGERATSCVKAKAEWPLATSPTGPGVADRKLEMQVSGG